MTDACYCNTLRTTTRKVTATYDEALAPIGVNVAQFALLLKIERAGAVSLTGLGRLSDLDRSTIGRNVKVLERMKLIRTAAGQDQREAIVKLTRQGARILSRGAPLWEMAQQRVETALGPEGASHLRACCRLSNAKTGVA
jgi:DNA-binding MarR family transcriptional regulator